MASFLWWCNSGNGGNGNYSTRSPYFHSQPPHVVCAPHSSHSGILRKGKSNNIKSAQKSPTATYHIENLNCDPSPWVHVRHFPACSLWPCSGHLPDPLTKFLPVGGALRPSGASHAHNSLSRSFTSAKASKTAIPTHCHALLPSPAFFFFLAPLSPCSYLAFSSLSHGLPPPLEHNLHKDGNFVYHRWPDLEQRSTWSCWAHIFWWSCCVKRISCLMWHVNQAEPQLTLSSRTWCGYTRCCRGRSACGCRWGWRGRWHWTMASASAAGLGNQVLCWVTRRRAGGSLCKCGIQTLLL